MTAIWMVRAGRNAAFLEDFMDKGIIAVGLSPHIGAEALEDSRVQLTARMKKAHPDKSKHWAANHAGQLFRFANELEEGHPVVTYDPDQRIYVYGTVSSPCRHDPSIIENHPYVHDVSWTHRIPRDSLSVSTRNTLGAIQTIFRLNADASKELETAKVPLSAAPDEVTLQTPPVVNSLPDELADLLAEVQEKSQEFIEDMLAKLDWEEMQDLVAGILRAMGYKARVSPKGADRGVDIFASPDGLGLEEPRIFVEVKHRQATPMGAQAVRAFLGGRQAGDSCLYVSTGGFTKDARYEADRSSVPLRLLGLPELRELLLEHYDHLAPEAKRLVPLTRVYWPLSDG